MRGAFGDSEVFPKNRAALRLGFTVFGSFRKVGVPYFGVPMIRILLYRVPYMRIPYFRKLPFGIRSLHPPSPTTATAKRKAAHADLGFKGSSFIGYTDR